MVLVRELGTLWKKAAWSWTHPCLCFALKWRHSKSRGHGDIFSLPRCNKSLLWLWYIALVYFSCVLFLNCQQTWNSLTVELGEWEALGSLNFISFSWSGQKYWWAWSWVPESALGTSCSGHTIGALVTCIGTIKISLLIISSFSAYCDAELHQNNSPTF